MNDQQIAQELHKELGQFSRDALYVLIWYLRKERKVIIDMLYKAYNWEYTYTMKEIEDLISEEWGTWLMKNVKND